jgi:hypothetical protein
MRQSEKGLLLAGVLALAWLLGPAVLPSRADLVVQLQSSNATSVTYSALFTDNGFTMKTGAYFTVFDLPVGSTVDPLTTTGLLNSNFSETTLLTGLTPPGTAPVDSPNLPNFTFTYTGSTSYSTVTPLGTFTVNIPVPFYIANQAGFQASRDTVTAGGAPFSHIGQFDQPIQTPAPSNLVLLMAGLPLFGILLVRRRRLVPALSPA